MVESIFCLSPFFLAESTSNSTKQVGDKPFVVFFEVLYSLAKTYKVAPEPHFRS
jgi:hypothetical protein